MSKLTITADRLRTLLNYDPETGHFSWKVKVNRRTLIGAIAGSKNSDGYIQIKLDGQPYYAHRLAWLYMTSEFPDVEVDHFDETPSNNRWINLRRATPGQNRQNISRPRAHSKSGVLGVSWNEKRKKWEANICAGGVRVRIGFFYSVAEAKAAYQAKKAELHPFARPESPLPQGLPA